MSATSPPGSSATRTEIVAVSLVEEKRRTSVLSGEVQLALRKTRGSPLKEAWRERSSSDSRCGPDKQTLPRVSGDPMEGACHSTVPPANDPSIKEGRLTHKEESLQGEVKGAGAALPTATEFWRAQIKINDDNRTLSTNCRRPPRKG